MLVCLYEVPSEQAKNYYIITHNQFRNDEDEEGEWNGKKNVWQQVATKRTNLALLVLVGSQYINRIVSAPATGPSCINRNRKKDDDLKEVLHEKKKKKNAHRT